MKDSSLIYGARAFVIYVKENSGGYTPTYQKFWDLMVEMMEDKLALFEEEIDNGDEIEEAMKERG